MGAVEKTQISEVIIFHRSKYYSKREEKKTYENGIKGMQNFQPNFFASNSAHAKEEEKNFEGRKIEKKKKRRKHQTAQKNCLGLFQLCCVFLMKR